MHSTIWTFIAFELRLRLRRPGIYLFSLLFATLAFAEITTDVVVMSGASGQTAINSPYAIAETLATMSVFGVLVVVAFTAGAVVRDFEEGAYQLFYTKPIRARDYLLGRFAGSFIATVAIVSASAFGHALGSLMPWLDQERLVPFTPTPYVHALVWLVIPTLLVMGSWFFAIATLTRRMLWAYVGVAGFFVVFSVSQTYISDLDNDVVAALSDPFGMGAYGLATRYWTPSERNTQLVPILGLLGLNRLLWVGTAVLAFAVTLLRFRLAAPPLRSKKLVDGDEGSHKDIAIPVVTLHAGPWTRLSQLWFQIRVELRGLVTGTAFIVLLLFAVLNVLGATLGSIDQMFDTPVYPVTHLMLFFIQAGMGLFLLIVITFYAGELVWKERRVGLAEMYDALPLPSFVPLVAKVVALLAAVALVSAACMVTTVVIQLSRGYTHLELGLYGRSLFGVQWFDWAMLVVLAVFFQVLANQRYLGFSLVGLHFVARIALPLLHYEHSLYTFAKAPDGPYSDMNDYGHFIAPMVWLRVYWGAAAVVLLLLANLAWVRGTDARPALRLRQARARVTTWNTALLAVAVLTFVGTGAFIYYNTNVLNRYRASNQALDLRARYEQQYKQYERLPQPRITAVELEADLHPERRRLELRGVLTLVNKTPAAIDRLHVQLDPDVTFTELSLDALVREVDDPELGYRIYRLDPPLGPGAALEVRFASVYEETGFKNGGSATDIVHNGSFFHNGRFLPHFGYDPGGEIWDPDERRKRDLPEKIRMLPVDDPWGRASTYISNEADWIEFKATVSTSADQIALAPGYLVREWTEGDRRYFRYEMDAPILNLYAFLSARYHVVRDRWNDVAIEIYHHEPHAYNVPRMIDAIKKSLDYCSKHFSPYQHRQIRIVEFPRYAGYAQSLPNIIPYSESIGFIADLRDDDDIDYVFYVTAHEVAHQWWAHQVIGANVRGSTVMSETLAQYSALMVMEQEYGREHMRKFMRHELDSYLRGRSVEQQREQPLVFVENQPYIHYNKGSLVMYTLREVLGEDVLNRALSSYLERVKYQAPPYTTSLELVDALRAVTPETYAYLIEDLFETITLYENRTVSATAKPVGPAEDDRYEITLELATKKLRADESGAEHEIPIDDWIEIGAVDEHDVVIHREPHRFTGSSATATIVVTGKPARAGIDPMGVLVDRDPNDNLHRVTLP